MGQGQRFEIFLATAPGLEHTLADEARAAGFEVTGHIPGGVSLQGGWPEVWRANLELRGAARVLARIGEFRAFHLAQLDKRARKFDWASVLRADVAVRVEVTTRKSKIYHAGAATQRIETAISDELGAPLAKDAGVVIKARIDDNLVQLSVDTTGEALHKRGHKVAVGKAPMRENMAAMFLAQCGYKPGEPLVDPMCGSGTFPIEAAEITAGLKPGRSRGFAFESLASFDAAVWGDLRGDATPPVASGAPMVFGFDRDAGAIKGAGDNAARAGVGDMCRFACQPVSDLHPPDGVGPGLVMVNPPYGGRIGNRKLLFALHGTLGEVLKIRFRGWRVGIITNDAGLAKATGLSFLPRAAPVAHGGLKVTLFQTRPL